MKYYLPGSITRSPVLSQIHWRIEDPRPEWRDSLLSDKYFQEVKQAAAQARMVMAGSGEALAASFQACFVCMQIWLWLTFWLIAGGYITFWLLRMYPPMMYSVIIVFTYVLDINECLMRFCCDLNDTQRQGTHPVCILIFWKFSVAFKSALWLGLSCCFSL